MNVVKDRCPCAKLLRNFGGMKRKMFLLLRISFAGKNNNLCNHCKSDFTQNCPIPLFATQVLRNAAIS